jgi:hypothetical protein
MLAVKQKKGFIATLLNDPNDAMGIDYMTLEHITINGKNSNLVKIGYSKYKDHSYGMTGGWGFSEDGIIIHDIKTGKEAIEFAYQRNSEEYLVELDSLDEVINQTETHCGFLFDYSIYPNGEIGLSNFHTESKGCDDFPEMEEGTYVLKKGVYVRKED